MRARTPLALVPQHFGSLVFDRRTARYLPFDAEATALLRRLRDAGLMASDTVPGKMTPGSRPARGDATSALPLEFFRHFERLGFFDLSGRFAADVLEATPPNDHLLGPLVVHLEVTATCNLSCAHCFAAPLPRPGRPLSLRELEALFAELASLGSFRLGITGGEPLLRPDLLEVLDLALGAGLHPCVTTNGLLVDEAMARELGRRELVWINVSLDGAAATANDAIRGAGTFDRVLERLSILRRHARFSLAFTLTSASAGEARACARLAKEVGAEAAVFRPLYPVGAARSRPGLATSFQDYSASVAALGEGLVDGERLFATDVFSPASRSPGAARVFTNPGCGAANVAASISASGDVSPCSFLGPDFVAGNLRTSSFRALWDDGAPFRRLRERHGEFRGGCRARSLAATGSVEGADPWQLAASASMETAHG